VNEWEVGELGSVMGIVDVVVVLGGGVGKRVLLDCSGRTYMLGMLWFEI
jgi:hypothetical protein